MLAKEDFMVIQALVKRGVYQRDIAQAVGVHPKTVQRALKRGAAPRARTGRRPSLLDAYRAQIDDLLAEGVWNGVVIWRELQACGYAGGVSILRDYIRPKRMLRPGRNGCCGPAGRRSGSRRRRASSCRVIGARWRR